MPTLELTEMQHQLLRHVDKVPDLDPEKEARYLVAIFIRLLALGKIGSGSAVLLAKQ